MNSKLPVLYSFRRCPYAIRARLAIASSRQSVVVREILLQDMPKEFLKLSSKATVPVLQLSDGRVIDESLDIMNWFLEQKDPDHWLNNHKEQQYQINKLIYENDNDFKTNLDHYKYADRYPEKSEEEYRCLGEHFLVKLEWHLNQAPYLFGEQITLADAAVFPFIRQFSEVNPKWFQCAPYTKLRAWLHQWLESKLFHSVMQKHPPWKNGNSPTVFKLP